MSQHAFPAACTKGKSNDLNELMHTVSETGVLN